MNRIKKYTAYIPTWGFYWLGHWTSLLMHLGMEFLFPLYSLFMNWSLFFNDWGDLDCWLDSTDE